MAEDLRYPIGPPPKADVIPCSDGDRSKIKEAIATIAALPELLRTAVEDLSPEQLNTPYRPGGWKVSQVVHHIADSHSNAAIRVRLALTEDWPAIKAYNEKAWAELGDAPAPVAWSLEIIEGVHARWTMLLRSLDASQWQRGFVHPERGRSTLEQATLLYQWHSGHHLAHITHLRVRMGW